MSKAGYLNTCLTNVHVISCGYHKNTTKHFFVFFFVLDDFTTFEKKSQGKNVIETYCMRVAVTLYMYSFTGTAGTDLLQYGCSNAVHCSQSRC